MDIQNNLSVRYPTEAKLLKYALNGDTAAVKRILYYLSSSNSILCQIMQKAIHDLQDSRIWHQLLRYLALHRWDEDIDRDQRFGLDALERIDQAIIEVFTQDDHKWEQLEKETILKAGLSDTSLFIQQACAYLLALRGDLQAIPVLANTVKNGIRKWQLRAVKALGTLNHTSCALPLLTALTMDRDELHREAFRALHNLGELAKSAWVKALNHPDRHIRWEASCGLGQIGDVRAVDILVEGLLEKQYSVRWTTVDVLTDLGDQAIPPILNTLGRYWLNEQTCEAAYHALHGILSTNEQELFEPLLAALHGSNPEIEVPPIAQRLQLDWEMLNEKK